MNGKVAEAALIRLTNKEEMVMPVQLKITQSNSKPEILNLPENIWQRGGVWTFKYPSTSSIIGIVMVPGNELPDSDLKTMSIRSINN